MATQRGTCGLEPTLERPRVQRKTEKNNNKQNTVDLEISRKIPTVVQTM